MTKTKKCTRCNKILSLDCFTTRRDRNSTVSGCKDCMKILRNKDYQKNNKKFKIEDIENEQWVDIKGYEGYYSVSNLGRIKSIARCNDRGFLIQSKILKPCYNNLGTSNVKLNKKSNKKSFYTHIIVATHFVENPKNKKEVKFIDGNKSNPKAVNLEWCDREDNFEYKKRDMSYSGKCKRDPLLPMKTLLRSRILSSLKSKGYIKKECTFKIIGISYDGLLKHLEKQFIKGMTWENRGYRGWHIDHKIPLASAKNEEELLKLFHYRNLRPLWAQENMKKHDKILPFQLHLNI